MVTIGWSPRCVFRKPHPEFQASICVAVVAGEYPSTATLRHSPYSPTTGLFAIASRHAQAQPRESPGRCPGCWKCHGIAGPNHSQLKNGGAICGMCSERNPLAKLKRIALGEFQARREVCVCFGPDTYHDGGMRFNLLSVPGAKLTGVRTVETEATFIRILKYLGATPGQIEDYANQRRSWGHGSAGITLLPNRKNLLGIDYAKTS
jgi:hypothetical protein